MTTTASVCKRLVVIIDVDLTAATTSFAARDGFCGSASSGSLQPPLGPAVGVGGSCSVIGGDGRHLLPPPPPYDAFVVLPLSVSLADALLLSGGGGGRCRGSGGDGQQQQQQQQQHASSSSHCVVMGAVDQLLSRGLEPLLLRMEGQYEKGVEGEGAADVGSTVAPRGGGGDASASATAVVVEAIFVVFGESPAVPGGEGTGDDSFFFQLALLAAIQDQLRFGLAAAEDSLRRRLSCAHIIHSAASDAGRLGGTRGVIPHQCLRRTIATRPIFTACVSTALSESAIARQRIIDTYGYAMVCPSYSHPSYSVSPTPPSPLPSLPYATVAAAGDKKMLPEAIARVLCRMGREEASGWHYSSNKNSNNNAAKKSNARHTDGDDTDGASLRWALSCPSCGKSGLSPSALSYHYPLYHVAEGKGHLPIGLLQHALAVFDAERDGEGGETEKGALPQPAEPERLLRYSPTEQLYKFNFACPYHHQFYHHQEVVAQQGQSVGVSPPCSVVFSNLSQVGDHLFHDHHYISSRSSDGEDEDVNGGGGCGSGVRDAGGIVATPAAATTKYTMVLAPPPPHRPSVSLFSFALVVVRRPRDGKYLLVQERSKRGWWLPGGGIDAAEDPIKGGVRETLEEAGVGVTVKGILSIKMASAASSAATACTRMWFILYAEPEEEDGATNTTNGACNGAHSPPSGVKCIPDHESCGACWATYEEVVNGCYSFHEEEEEAARQRRVQEEGEAEEARTSGAMDVRHHMSQQQRGRLVMRGTEPREYFGIVEGGGPIYPLALLHVMAAKTTGAAAPH